MDVFKILASLMSLLSEPEGKAILQRIFIDHNMSVDSVQKIVAGLKPPPPLPPVNDNIDNTKN